MIIPKGILKILLETRDSKHLNAVCRGVHVFSTGYVAASDGNVAFVSNELDMKSTSVTQDILISLGAISLGGIENFIVDVNSSCLTGLNKKDEVVSMFPFTLESVSPVNFRNVYAKHKQSQNGCLTLDPKYMKRLASVFPDNSDVYFRIGEEGTPSIAIGDQGALIIMPRKPKPRSLPKILQDISLDNFKVDTATVE